jgi:uncharacterized membrane protein YraQ (UPF0718 family)
VVGLFRDRQKTARQTVSSAEPIELFSDWQTGAVDVRASFGSSRRNRPGSNHQTKAFPVLELALLALLVGVLFRGSIGDAVPAALRHWATVFLAIVVQAVPFLVLGTVLSGAIAAFLKPSVLTALLPKNPLLAVPVAALSGVVLPGCECSSVPVAARLSQRGVPFSAAVAFLLASPAINPIVLVATAVAFPRQPMMWVARFVASVLVASIVGLIWERFGRREWLLEAFGATDDAHDSSPWRTFLEASQHDFLHAAGFLVLGGATAATLQTVVPRSLLEDLGSLGLLSVLLLGALAVVLSICSEADAFVAAGLTQFSLTARLAFLVVGPMVDLKLIALQTGTFGRRFAMRFAPLTLVVALVVSSLVGSVLL